MSATAAIIGAGTTLGYTAVGGSVYTTLSELIDVAFPESTVGDADATRYDSPSTTAGVHVNEHLPTYLEPGEVSFEVHYITTQAASLITTIVGIPKQFLITLPDTHTVTFTGYVNKDGGPIPMKGTINQKCSIKLTGPVTYA